MPSCSVILLSCTIPALSRSACSWCVQGKNVYKFTEDILQPNNYTYWIPPPPPLDPVAPPPPPADNVQGINVRNPTGLNCQFCSSFMCWKESESMHRSAVLVLVMHALILVPWIVMVCPNALALCLQPPDFYLATPPAPPGLMWWRLKPDVPPIPDLGPQFAGYTTLYDPKWRPKNYVPNNMDTVRAAS